MINKDNVKEITGYFEGFRKKITDKLIDDVVYARKRDKQNGNTLLVCSAIYYCSDNEIREMLEEDLGKDDLSIKVGKDLLKAVGKEVIEEKSKSRSFTEKLNFEKMNRGRSAGSFIIGGKN